MSDKTPIATDVNGEDLFDGDLVMLNTAPGSGDMDKGSIFYGILRDNPMYKNPAEMQIFRIDGQSGGGTRHEEHGELNGWVFSLEASQLMLVERAEERETFEFPDLREHDEETTEFYHMMITTGVEAFTESHNARLESAGEDWRITDVMKDRMIVVLKMIVPGMTPAEAWIIKGVLEGILIFSGTKMLLDKLGIDDPEEIHKLMGAVAGSGFEGALFDAQDKDAMKLRVKASRKAEEVIFDIDADDPADAIMRRFSLGNN